MERRATLTVVETVYHRPVDGEPIGISGNFSSDLETDEQIYSRRATATEEWKPLDFGWLKETGVGLIHLKNREGTERTVIPSEEEAAELSERVIEIAGRRISPMSLPELTWTVPPGETFRGRPKLGQELFIRCLKGTARYTLTVIPR